MDHHSLLSLATQSGFVFVGALVGGSVPLIKNWKDVHLHDFISFGAGVLMGASFLHMIPESTELIGTKVGTAVLIGFLIFYLLERFIMIHPCYENACEAHHVGLSAFLGFSFHNITDGIALGASFVVPELSPFVFLALISHHGPTSFAFTSILKASRYPVRQIIILMIAFASMVPIGAFITFKLVEGWTRIPIGWAIGISAGTFIHIALCDLLPQIHKVEHHRKLHCLISFLVGLGLMVGLTFIEVL